MHTRFRIHRSSVVTVIAVFFVAGLAHADPNNGTSQWLTRKASEGYTKIDNPNNVDMCAFVIMYNDDGTFYSCTKGDLLARTSISLDAYIDDSDDDNDGYSEVIAVPVSKGKVGPINPTKYGILARMHKNQMHVMDAKTYAVSGDPDVVDDVRDCICSELDSASLPPTLFKKFGYKCP